jgi:hypothetical protein
VESVKRAANTHSFSNALIGKLYSYAQTIAESLRKTNRETWSFQRGNQADEGTMCNAAKNLRKNSFLNQKSVALSG